MYQLPQQLALAGMQEVVNTGYPYLSVMLIIDSPAEMEGQLENQYTEQ